MENNLNLSLEDSKIRKLFAGKKPGNKVTVTVKGMISEITSNHVTASVEAVDGKVTFEGDVADNAENPPVLEVMK